MMFILTYGQSRVVVTLRPDHVPSIPSREGVAATHLTPSILVGIDLSRVRCQIKDAAVIVSYCRQVKGHMDLDEGCQRENLLQGSRKGGKTILSTTVEARTSHNYIRGTAESRILKFEAEHLA